jgi:hypothetical protein
MGRAVGLARVVLNWCVSIVNLKNDSVYELTVQRGVMEKSPVIRECAGS